MLPYQWLLALIGLFCASAGAATVQVAFAEQKPPYVLPAGQGGLEIDLVREALAFRGHRLSVTLLPKRRIESMRDTEQFDALATIRVEEDVPRRYYSAPYLTFQNYAITKASANLSIEHWSDLIGLRVLAWPNARVDMGPAFARATVSDLYAEYPQAQQNAFFWRYDNAVILVDRRIFNWYRRELRERFDTRAAVDYHPLFERGSSYGVLFSRRSAAR